MNTQIRNIVKNAIDLHVHVGPELIPRKYTVEKLLKSEVGKIAGLALKNHFFPTVGFIAEQPEDKKLKLFGSVVLNNFVGGLNADAIYAVATIATNPFIVWLPTTSAKQFLSQSDWEIAPEWVQNKNIKTRKANEIIPVKITNSRNDLLEDTIQVLKAIQSTQAILATGHISWQESEKVVIETIRLGQKKIIITHPIYQKIHMPIAQQKKMSLKGAMIEECYSMISIDKIPVKKVVEQIRAVGAEGCIMSSDVGQTFSPSPSDALMLFANLLLNEGITLKELYTMLVVNPNKLIEK